MALVWKAALATSSIGAVGLIMIASSAEAAITLLGAQAVGASTPISGITLGILAGAFATGLVFLWKGSVWLLQMGALLSEWQTVMRDVPRITENLNALEERVAASERWQRAHDPIVAELLVRMGLQPPERNKEREA